MGFINHGSTLYPNDICSDKPDNEREILKKNPISSLTRTCSHVVPRSSTLNRKSRPNELSTLDKFSLFLLRGEWVAVALSPCECSYAAWGLGFVCLYQQQAGLENGETGYLHYECVQDVGHPKPEHQTLNPKP